MTTYMSVLDSLGWAVLHSIWQGGVAWLIVLGFRQALPQISPNVRCNLSISVLLLTFVAFIGTFALYLGLSGSNARDLSPLLLESVNSLAGTDPSSTTLTALPGANGEAIGSSWAEYLGGGLFGSFQGTDYLSAATPFIAALWVVGFILTALRYSFGYMAAQQLRTLGISMPEREWLTRFYELCKRSNLSRPVALRISNRVSQPLTLGILKPVVLVPVGFLTALPSDQVEAILLHELGHIRRYDYALNLAQTAVKTVLFYHPAIHAIGRMIDQDREEACDDHAISRGPDGSVLARGLASLRLIQSQIRTATHIDQDGSHFSMAALGSSEPSTNSPLMRRLSRLAGQGESTRPEPVMMSALTALLLGSVYLATPSGAKAHPHKSDEVPLRLEAPIPPVPVEPVRVDPVRIEPVQPPVITPFAQVENGELAGAPTDGTLPLSAPTMPTPPVPPANVPVPEIDQAAIDAILAENDQLIADMNNKIAKYSSKIAELAMQPDFDEDEIEALAEKIERIAEHYESKIEMREHKIDAEIDAAMENWETRFEAQYSEEHEAAWEAYEAEMERWAEAYEARIEAQAELIESEAERATERAEMIAERHADAIAARHADKQARKYAQQTARDAQKDAMKRQREMMKRQQKEQQIARQEQMVAAQEQRIAEQEQRVAAQQQRHAERMQREAARHQRDAARHQREMARHQREAERHQREVERQARAQDRKAEKYEVFQEEVTRELVRDGLIRNARETARLTHIDDVMSINGKAMPKALRGKYCKMMDDMGLKDHSTEVTLKPGSLHISTESEEGRQSTKITYGRTEF